MSITVKDVAKKAGVATSTVSRVINNHPSISEETKRKVRKVMDELGYTPNLAARNLGKKTASAIGVVLPPLNTKERLGNPFYLETIETINEEARKFNMSVAVASARDFDTLLANVEQMHRQKQVDGFILTYSDKYDPIITYLIEKKIPFTLIGQPYTQEESIVYVDNDNQLLGKQATDHLIDKGHQRILFITNTTHENLYFERYFGYQKALMMANLPLFPVVSFEETQDYPEFLEVLQETKATALVVIDDLFAVRIIQLAQLLGYKVPDDLSVISFNNSIFTTLTHPYLTSIDIDVASLGSIATQQLMAQLTNQEMHSSLRVVVPHELIQRETVLNKKFK
ncbi:LacI family transcriptional regulator [Enterococcus alcedinis]|uniref:LacI family transcriptional regulator n=1 Tax=Enterococcus alcedinis TaxID=1274384 RepID=A0A917N793_9ENTE|nr:LacI family DNA-binding transcriptional regulator [Enterococcus alcedinis]MBP2103090.1 LacI family transcriptional regulator [Enterococcus alcedinis]GGI66652.1 LacI family transcriptional regulator [Enterococcus alcedinis]